LTFSGSLLDLEYERGVLDLKLCICVCVTEFVNLFWSLDLDTDLAIVQRVGGARQPGNKLRSFSQKINLISLWINDPHITYIKLIRIDILTKSSGKL
jgi:hypothetical protein